MFYSSTRSDQPGSGTITADKETKHLLLNASRLHCDMFAVLSSSDVWPTVIHFKRLACAALSPAKSLSRSLVLFLLCQLSRMTDNLFSLTFSFLFSCELFYSHVLNSVWHVSAFSPLNPRSLCCLLPLWPWSKASSGLRALWWWDLIPPLLNDPHLISHVRLVVKQVNF